jgi:hypothetical protein
VPKNAEFSDVSKSILDNLGFVTSALDPSSNHVRASFALLWIEDTRPQNVDKVLKFLYAIETGGLTDTAREALFKRMSELEQHFPLNTDIDTISAWLSDNLLCDAPIIKDQVPDLGEAIKSCGDLVLSLMTDRLVREYVQKRLDGGSL